MNEELEFDLGFDEVDTPIETENVEENVETVENVEENVENTEVIPESETVSEIQKMKLKYNHQEVELPLDEIQVLAQKGMNYDKLQEKLHQAENNIGIQYLNDLAKRNGTDIEGLVNYWKEQERQAELNQLIQNNIPQELAQEILENRKYREQQQEAQRINEEKQRQELEFKDFFESFPDVKPDSIPSEVWAKNEEGTPLKFAYMEYEMNRLRNENKVLSNNNTNKRKAVVNPVGSGNDENYDAFLDGFNSY